MFYDDVDDDDTHPFRVRLAHVKVSTSTGVISHFVNLQVVVPEAFILGSGELHVDMGSTINLVCIIEKVSASSKYILHNINSYALEHRHDKYIYIYTDKTTIVLLMVINAVNVPSPRPPLIQYILCLCE